MPTINWWDFEFARLEIPVSTAGTPYRRSVAVGMPRIPPQVLQSTFYLYPSVEAAKAGDKFGGTGFFVAYPTGIPVAPSLVYAVTNWHVAVRDGCSVMRVNTIGGGVDIFDFDPSEWEFPPGGPDLAVMPHDKLGLRESMHLIVPLEVNLLLSRLDVLNLELNPGEDIFMIGRFVDHDGAASNVPSARFGNISVMPQEVLQPTGGRFESFTLDIHSRTGYSGSPAFVYRTFGSDLTTDQFTPAHTNILDGRIRAGSRDHFVRLLGLHWGQFPEQWEIKKAKAQRKTQSQAVPVEGDDRYIEGMSGMTLAIPAWNIRDFLDMPKLKNKRTKAIDQILKATGGDPGPVAESALPANDAEPNHRDRFNSLLDAAARKREPKD